MKYFFEKGMGDNECTYPLTQEQLDKLKPCRLESPMVGESFGLKIPDNFSIDDASEEIQRVRLEVEKGIYPQWFMEKHWPYKFQIPTHMPEALKEEGLSFNDPARLANIVHMDLPTLMPHAVLRWLLSEGANVKAWTPSHVNFVETIPDVIENIADGVKRALYKIFKIKYYFGLPRYEEVMERQTGINGALFTAYEKGSPSHPSFGQGHEAAAVGATRELIKSFDLTNEQIEEILYITYLWGQFRCLAGVHYGVDAIVSIIACGFKKYVRPEIVAEYTA